jgi:hypothetical protein
MATQLNFSYNDDVILESRAGIDLAFLAKINQVVADIRYLKVIRPGVGTVVAKLTSPTGEVFEITVS